MFLIKVSVIDTIPTKVKPKIAALPYKPIAPSNHMGRHIPNACNIVKPINVLISPIRLASAPHSGFDNIANTPTTSQMSNPAYVCVVRRCAAMTGKKVAEVI